MLCHPVTLLFPGLCMANSISVLGVQAESSPGPSRMEADWKTLFYMSMGGEQNVLDVVTPMEMAVTKEYLYLYGYSYAASGPMDHPHPAPGQ